jgi:hypothetical protein
MFSILFCIVSILSCMFTILFCMFTILSPCSSTLGRAYAELQGMID